MTFGVALASSFQESMLPSDLLDATPSVHYNAFTGGSAKRI